MKLHVVAVGRLKNGPERALIDAYRQRIPWTVSETEVEERRPLPGPERQTREAELLLAAVPQNAWVVALDAAGASWSSDDFARRLAQWRGQGREVAFLIGGADGHGPAALAKADVTMSLGSMTWPHALARVLLMEQLYRAHCIHTGHPYHK